MHYNRLGLVVVCTKRYGAAGYVTMSRDVSGHGMLLLLLPIDCHDLSRTVLTMWELGRAMRRHLGGAHQSGRGESILSRHWRNICKYIKGRRYRNVLTVTHRRRVLQCTRLLNRGCPFTTHGHVSVGAHGRTRFTAHRKGATISVSSLGKALEMDSEARVTEKRRFAGSVRDRGTYSWLPVPPAC